MGKVILVDGEKLIRQELLVMVDWKSYGFEVIGEASKGREALLLYKDLRPDLMVIDICLPDINGFQLIEEIRKLNTDCQFIIVSGHADFSYAKTAISLGAKAFILKPVDVNEIETELMRIRKLMQKKSERSAGESKWGRMISLLLANEQGNLPVSFQSINWQLYRVMLLKLYSPDCNSRVLLEAIKLKLMRHFEDREEGVVFIHDSKVGVVLRETRLNNLDATGLYCELLKTLVLENGQFIAVMGEAVESIVDIGKSYYQAVNLLKNEFLYRGETRIIDRSANILLQEEPDIGILSEKLYYAIDFGSRSLLRRVLEEGLLSIAQYYGIEQAIKAAASQWISLMLTRLLKMNNIAYFDIQDTESLASDIFKQPNFQTLQRMIEDRLMLILDRSGSQCRDDTVIAQVLDFVECHYSENLKLKTLGEKFHYNSAYLGQLFRSVTGDPFRTYLDKVRIRKAKVLLECGLKVHEVAARVGISNVNYFHIKFKKNLGKKPSHYKAKSSKDRGTSAL